MAYLYMYVHLGDKHWDFIATSFAPRLAPLKSSIVNVIPCHRIASLSSLEALSAFLPACATFADNTGIIRTCHLPNVLSTFEYLQKGIVVWKSHLSVSFLFLFCFASGPKKDTKGSLYSCLALSWLGFPVYPRFVIITFWFLICKVGCPSLVKGGFK